MDDEQLTFERLFDLLRAEKGSASLQKLPDSYFSQVITYLSAKVALAKNSATSEVGAYDHSLQQLRNARKIIQEIYDRREKKIIALATSKSRTSDHITDTSTLLLEEMSLYSSLVNLLSFFRKGVITSVCDLQKPFADNPEGLQIKQYGVQRAAIARPKTDSTVKKEESTSKSEQKSAKVTDQIEKFLVLEDIPECMAPNMQMIGPFKKGEVISLDAKVSVILLKNKQIEPQE